MFSPCGSQDEGGDGTVTIGEGTGLLGLLRGWLLDRPGLKVLAIFNDYGSPEPGWISTRVGKCVRVEVHCTRRVPVRVTSIGFELTNGQVVELEDGDRLPKVLNRPDLCERWVYRETLARRLSEAGPRVRLRGTRVVASPDHAFRRRLPKGWGRFPESDPPVSPPNEGGPHCFAGWF
jgi:hypothetical protein